MAEQTIQLMTGGIQTELTRIDMAEIRADFLDVGELKNVAEIPEMVEAPLIFTLRRSADGGMWSGSESERHTVLLNAAAAGFAFLDLESDVFYPDVEQACARAGTRIIRSLHDFEGVPADLTEVVINLPHHEGEIPKVAVMPRRTQDLVDIVETCHRLLHIESIVIGMGSWGFASRILAGKLGSFLTFCSLASKEVAPGHLDPYRLVETYRFRDIRDTTDVFCVIANPVMHSKSPQIHNPALIEEDLDAVYIPIQVDDLEIFLQLVPLLDIKGASVTVPHKSAVRGFLKGEEAAVDAVGACNTVFYKSGELWGANTDVDGFIEPVGKFASKSEIGRMSVTVVGAGGTTRAVVYGLRQLGARVLIVNRTPEKAADLAREFGCEWAPLALYSLDRILEHNDLIVQTTSAGMHPNEDQDPMGFYDFTGGEIVYDVIYAPPETRFLRRAREAGCRTLNGEQMLLEQAYLQFKHFTGRPYPEICKGSGFTG